MDFYGDDERIRVWVICCSRQKSASAISQLKSGPMPVIQEEEGGNGVWGRWGASVERGWGGRRESARGEGQYMSAACDAVVRAWLMVAAWVGLDRSTPQRLCRATRSRGVDDPDVAAASAQAAAAAQGLLGRCSAFTRASRRRASSALRPSGNRSRYMPSKVSALR